MKLVFAFIVFLFSGIILQSKGQHTNIFISDFNSPNEPSIVINPKNTDELFAGANIDSYYYSTDGGFNWTEGTLTSTYGVWGDPVFACDTAENFYFFHLSNPPSGNWIDRIVCQRTSSPGGSWNNGSFTGLNGTKAQDKQWVTIDRGTNEIFMTWTEFDEYASTAPQDSSRILFSKSADQGQTWTTPLKINQVSGDCIDEDNTVEGAVPALGPNGEVYVSWVGPLGIVFDKSLDGGQTWMAQDKIVTTVPGGWDYSIAGIYRANGLPVTTCDTSGGPNNGTIYINWTDQRNGTNNTDVWLVKSTDGGNTWTLPTIVNDDGLTRQQFFTWMTIDQTNGNLWFVFYDRRNYNDTRTDVYMARSSDGGLTFENFKVSDTPFIPNSGIFFGDYTNITAHNDVIRPIWTRLHNNELSIWTAIVNTTLVGVSDFYPEGISLLEQNYPNPFSTSTTFSFKLHQTETVTLSVYDFSGRLIFKPIVNEILGYGKHIKTFNQQLAPGTYFYEIETKSGVMRRKMIVVTNYD